MTEGPHFPTSFTPDGVQIIFLQPADAAPFDVGVVSLEGEQGVELLLEESYSEMNAEVSPDGRWIAYESDESGQPEIYVRPFPDVDASRTQVSTEGGTRPLWSRNGRELFYYVAPGTIMAVPVQPGTGFAPGRPEVAIQGSYAVALNAGRHYDVSADGRRFLLLSEGGDTETDESTTPRINVVLNWFEELTARVPVE